MDKKREEFFASAAASSHPLQVLDMDEMPPDIVMAMVNLQPKLDAARDRDEILLLDATEAPVIAFLCRNMKIPPFSNPEVIREIELLMTRADTAMSSNGSMTLSPGESRYFRIHVDRDDLHYLSRMTSSEILNSCDVYAHKYNVDGSHPLDFRRDLTRDYSVELALTMEELELKLQRMRPSEIEQYAEHEFFCDLTCVEKLESMSQGIKSSFNPKEAHRLLSLGTRFLSANPNVKGGSRLSTEHPQNRAGRKLAKIKTGDNSTAPLTIEEAAAFLPTCQYLPRPKALQDLAVGQQAQKPQSRAESREHVFDTEEHSMTILAELYDFFAQRFPEFMPDLKNTAGPKEAAPIIQKAVVSIQEQLKTAQKSLEEKEKELTIVRSSNENLKVEHNEEVKKLNKKVAVKERTLVEKEKLLALTGKSNHQHQEELKSEINRAKSEAEKLIHELEKARKEPDKVKEQWSGKIQKLHDKVAAKNAELTSEKQARQILKLDADATLEDLRLCREEVDGLQSKLDAQKASAKNVDNLIKKNEGLQKSLAVAKTNQRIETDRINSAVTKAIAPLADEIKQLKRLRDSDAKDIEELSRSNETKASKIVALEKCLGESEEVQDATLEQLEKERAKKEVKGRSEADFAALEIELAEERAKSNRLGEILMPMLTATAAASAALKAL